MIQQVAHARVWPWRSRAAKERVDLKDTPTTRWFMYEDVACAGLLSLRKGVRIRGVYVDPAFRHLGLGTTITEHLISVAIQEEAPFVEAFVWHPKWYWARDFQEIAVNPHGAILMRRVLKTA